MPQEKDRRVRRTRARLEQAMLELMQEKDARSVTVQELARRADVNRGTFYAHYKDISDLLDQMEEELFVRLDRLLSAYSDRELSRELTPLLADVFRFVRDEPALRVAFQDQATQNSFFRRLDQLIYQKCREDWRGLFLPTDRQLWSGCLDFMVAGAVGLIRGWMDRGFQEDPEQLAQLANRLILRGLSLF